jgi:predicted CopG family antitoxin
MIREETYQRLLEIKKESKKSFSEIIEILLEHQSYKEQIEDLRRYIEEKTEAILSILRLLRTPREIARSESHLDILKWRVDYASKGYCRVCHNTKPTPKEAYHTRTWLHSILLECKTCGTLYLAKFPQPLIKVNEEIKKWLEEQEIKLREYDQVSKDKKLATQITIPK